MFPSVGGRLNNRDADFNSYMCGECFMLPDRLHRHEQSFNSYMRGECFQFCENVKVVSIHICTENVFIEPTHMRVLPFRFQFIYVRGMFSFLYDYAHQITSVSTHIRAGNVSEFWEQANKMLKFQFIYAREMFPQVHRPGHEAGGFDSYMCGECFRGCCYSRLRSGVSIHICARNVSPMVTIRLIMPSFQLMYVRGMFLLLDWTYLSLVSIHICAGNVSVVFLAVE